MVVKDELLRIFARRIRDGLWRAELNWETVQEIRLRAGRPVFVVCDGREYRVAENGRLLGADEEYGTARGRGIAGGYEAIGSRKAVDGYRAVMDRGAGDWDNENRAAGGCEKDSGPQAAEELKATAEELKETLEYIGNHSLYAFEEEIRRGFITLPGGHRVGLAGKAVLDEGGIRTLKHISFLNVRLAHQIRGCADGVMPYLYKDGQPLHTLVISPPRCGKTTLLRDMIRQISDGTATDIFAEAAEGKCGRAVGMTVGVVDERSELAACWQGIPQNDLGARTDVLDCCPKARGMMMLLRAMSPDVIAVDEIGSREDLKAMEYVLNCGCRLLATVHGASVEDVARKPVLRKMMERRMFERYIVLSRRCGVGTVEEIRGGEGTVLYRREGFSPPEADASSAALHWRAETGRTRRRVEDGPGRRENLAGGERLCG